MRSIIAILVFSFSWMSQAEIVSQTALELQLQQKIYSIVKPIDDSAIIITNLTYKKVDLALPGTGSSFYEMFAPNGSDQVAYDSIDSVQIRIISKLNPFPDSLKNLVNSAVKIDKTKIKFSFEEMDAALVDLSKKNGSESVRNWLEPVTQQFKEIFSSLSQKFTIFGALMILSALIIMAIIYVLISDREKKSQSFWGQTASRLIDGVNGFSGGASLMTSAARGASAYNEPRRAEGFASGSDTSSNNQVKDLSAQAVKMLMADCYWCEEDHYAAWVWSMLSSSQRTDLLKQWPPALQYIPYIVKLKPEFRTDHLNSCYLVSFDLSMVSHEDLIEWIRRHPESWSMLSPMRQAHLKLSLKEKINLASKNSPTKELPPPQLQSTLRAFEASVEVGDLSEVDEMSLFKNPEFVPNALRPQVLSLVWVALLPLEQRTSLLEEFSAQTLAEAWIGPQPVLESLKQVLSDKKAALLNGYTKTVAPSRYSEAMQTLTARALFLLDKPAQSEETVNAQVV